MSWRVEFTSQARADLVGLDRQISEAITDALVDWLEHGPPMRGERKLAEITFYEERVAGRVVIGYVVRRDPDAFALLWVRDAPPGRRT